MGYMYDEETGLYYLRERYYSSIWERFVLPDCIVNYNMNSYCHNSPVVRLDLSGKEDCYIYTFDGIPSTVFAGINLNDLQPNSVHHFQNGSGDDYYIWTDNDAKPIHSRHYSNHGRNNSTVPNPHDHIWKDKNDDSGHREQSHEHLPPDDAFSEENAIEISNNHFSLPEPELRHFNNQSFGVEALLVILFGCLRELVYVAVPLVL